jgi:class 3 adenylate cyclase
MPSTAPQPKTIHLEPGLYGAVGPATNLAARLRARASPGQTLIGQRAATEEAVDTTPVGSLELKGPDAR